MNLPLFPLRTVFFPGETVPLHIFEPRYKALIEDCHRESQTFGIPVFIDNTLSYGTEVQLARVVNTYADGSRDVVCAARQVFRLKSFESLWSGKPYPGGEVEFLDQIRDSDPDLKQRVITGIQDLYKLMDLTHEPIDPERFNSFTLAHKIGLSMRQEFDLLRMTSEAMRLQFIFDHLQQTAEVLSQLNATRERIEMNGHFRNYDPLDFEDFKLE